MLHSGGVRGGGGRWFAVVLVLFFVGGVLWLFVVLLFGFVVRRRRGLVWCCRGVVVGVVYASLVSVCCVCVSAVVFVVGWPGRVLSGRRWLVRSVSCCVVGRRCVVRPCVVRCVVSVVGFAGSRSLPSLSASGGLVSRVVGSVVAAGRPVAVGDCVGADAAVLSARLRLPFPSSSSGPALSVFAVGGPSAGGSFVSRLASLSGFWRGSAVGQVRVAAALAVSPGHGCVAPVVVRWWAGGAASVPLRSRLSGRPAAGSPVRLALVSGPVPGVGCRWRLSCSVCCWPGARRPAFFLLGGFAHVTQFCFSCCALVSLVPVCR